MRGSSFQSFAKKGFRVVERPTEYGTLMDTYIGFVLSYTYSPLICRLGFSDRS